MNDDSYFLRGEMTGPSTMTIIDPCLSRSPLIRIGEVELISVGCSKDRGHEGDHEWTLSWKEPDE